jgi:gliding motility-associated-like protein
MNLLPKLFNQMKKRQIPYCLWAFRFFLFFNFLSVTQAQIINGSPSVCAGDSTTLAANSGFQSYRWSNGSVGQSISVKNTGKYFVTVMDGRGIPMVDSFIFTVHPLPDGSIVGSPYVCYGRSALLGVEGNFRSVQWSNGERTNQIAVVAVGAYSVNIIDSNGCKANGNIQVLDGSKTYNALPDTVKICKGDSAILDATTAFARSYYWNTDDTTATITVKDSARYNVIVSSGQCVNYDTVHVIVLPAPQVFLGLDTSICKGDSLILKAEKSTYYAYKWNTGSNRPEITVRQDGIYGVEVTFGKCKASDSTNIQIFNKEPGKIHDTIICTPSLNIKPILRGVTTYKWGSGSTDSSITVSKSSNYQVVMSNNKCVVSWFYNLTFKKLAVLNLGKDTVLCQDLKRAELLLKAGDADDTYYEWQDGSTPPQYQVKKTGHYTLKAINECGEARDEIDVVIKNCYEVFVPTSFSPDNDGVNETFQVYPTQNIRKILRFNVFDRWGNLVYAASNFMQDDAVKNGWDGTFKGKTLAPTVFVYFIEMETTEGAVVMQKGDVTLMR